jgi:tetratricopeptide (TPR) repeat protein
VTTGEALIDLAAARSARPATEAVIGDVVNTASRLQGIAPPGGVVIDEATWRAARRRFRLDPLDPVRVKGKAGPVRIWRVAGTRSRLGADVGHRPETPLVGREAELDELQGAFRKVLAEHQPELVTITGEPGVGKTRLVQELFAFADDYPELVAWRQGRCLPYGDGIAFNAIGDIVKSQAGVLESDGPERVEAKLRAAVDAVSDDPEERDWLAACLATLVGLPADRTGRAELFAAWRRFLAGVATISPTVVVVEDLHWAEDALLEFLSGLVQEASGDLLVVTTARPELTVRAPGWDAVKRATAIRLPPLPDEAMAALLAALLDEQDLPAGVRAPLLERAGGNPLYAEELVRFLTERHLLVDGPAGPSLALTGKVPFPDSVQALIAARIDTLDPSGKSLLQDAAVVGRSFWPGALAAVGAVPEAGLADGLAELTRRELIRPVRNSSVRGQDEYAFSHGLVRDVTYGQIPRGERARRHRAVAGWLEQLGDDRLDDNAELLAHHYSQALELTGAAGLPVDEALTAAARRWLLAAGERLLRLDVAKAPGPLADAVALSPPGTAGHAQALVMLADATSESGHTGEAVGLYEEAIAELRALGDAVAAAGALGPYSRLLRNQGRPADARAATTEALALLDGHPPGKELAAVYLSMAFDALVTGHAEQTMQDAGRGLDLAGQLGLTRERVLALELRGSARNHLGDVRALDDLRQALGLARETGVARLIGRVANNMAEEQWPVEGPAAALRTLAVGIDVTERRGLGRIAKWLRATGLGLYWDQGDWDELLRSAAELGEWARSQGEQSLAVWSALRRAQVLLQRGDTATAAALAAEATPLARENGEAELLIPALTLAAVVARAEGRGETAAGLVTEVGRIAVGKVAWYCANDLPDLVRVAAGEGRLQLAASLVYRVRSPAPRHRHGVLTGRAVLAEAGGDLRDAAALYDQAATGWSSFGGVFEHGMALLGAGRCLAGLGRPDAAASRLAGARDLFARLDAAPALAEVGDLLTRLRHAAG